MVAQEMAAGAGQLGEMLAAERKREKMLNDECRDLENEVAMLQDEAHAAVLKENKTARERQGGADAFDVETMHVRDFPFLAAKEGQPFLRGGVTRVWHMHDLQSFTPLRFLPPKLMGHEGRAGVIDPDVFAVGDIFAY